MNVIDVDPVSITGTVPTPLPANTALGDNYPVVFTFTNNNATFTSNGGQRSEKSAELYAILKHLHQHYCVK